MKKNIPQEIINTFPDLPYEKIDNGFRWYLGSENKFITIYETTDQDLIINFPDYGILKNEIISLNQAIKILKIYKLSNFS